MLEAMSSMFIAQADQAATPLMQQTWVFALLLIFAVAAGLFLARMITNSLALVDYAGRMSIVLVSLLVAALIIFSNWPPKFGVDLRGGINMIGSLNLDKFEDQTEAPTASDIIPTLMTRVNPSGTKEIMIRSLGEDKIEVTMPTVDRTEAANIWKRLVNTGKLEFRIIANRNDHPKVINAAETQLRLKTRERRQDLVKDKDGKNVAKWVRLARVYKENIDRKDQQHAPFKYVPDGRIQPMVRNTTTFELVNLQQVPFRSEDPGVDLAKWSEDQGYQSLQVLVAIPEPKEDVEGGYLRGIQRVPDEKGRNSIVFSLTGEGTNKMGRLTSKNKGRNMGIVLGDEIHSAPVINEAIFNRGTIEGSFTRKEIDDLILNLKSGKLDVALNKSPISTDFIESTLGAELKQKGIIAIAASLVLVLVFMVFYYRFAGVVASLALVLNLLLILALIMAIDYPLTLTGLAGLVLTVGMSVDANVLIFERIREEIDRGAALRMAIRNGFEKATVTIFDANLTTLITALVLYAMGTEQIKGFAVTLFLGIVISMYTAIFVSRLVFDVWERKRWLKELNMTRMLEKSTYSFLNKVSMTAVASVVLIAAGLVGVYLLGNKILDQDLRGGSTARIVFKEQTTKEYVQEKLDALPPIVYKATPDSAGEEVEFDVDSFGGGDAATKGRKFKIDSNLPAWEGADSGVEQFKELDVILAETFKDELEMHHVEIEGFESASLDTEKNRGEVLHRLVSYQEESTEPTEPTTPAGTDQEPEGQAEASSAGAADATQENGADPVDGSDVAAPQDDPAPTEPAAPEVSSDVVKITRKMTFDRGMLGKTLVAKILDTTNDAETFNLGLEEKEVVLDSPDMGPDDSPNGIISKNWTVEMAVVDVATADKALQKFQSEFNNETYFEGNSQVGGQIAKETQQDAGVAILISLLGIVGYCWFRFQNLAFGLAAVIALVHDVLFVLGAIAITHWVAGFLGFLLVDEFKISLEVIAALLTVIGYSLNDTIVVFDRIREVRGKRTEITAEMIDTSISQTLSRTILTSVTTFIVVFILYLFGGEAIHGFAFALVVGVIVGTYSSIFVASPALLWLMNTVGLNPGEVDPEVVDAAT